MKAAEMQRYEHDMNEVIFFFCRFRYDTKAKIFARVKRVYNIIKNGVSLKAVCLNDLAGFFHRPECLLFSRRFLAVEKK